MSAPEKIFITVKSIINAPVGKVWERWTVPNHIIHWCNASDDWHAPRAENDLRAGGKFLTRMEARDGSMGFDFNGVYSHVELNKKIAYTIEDGRQVDISFVENDGKTEVVESFEAENENSIELQQAGWQAILDNFKIYAES